jgi:hypothetical protein
MFRAEETTVFGYRIQAWQSTTPAAEEGAAAPPATARKVTVTARTSRRIASRL